MRGRNLKKLAFAAVLFAALFLSSPPVTHAFNWRTWYNPYTWFRPAAQPAVGIFTGTIKLNSNVVTLPGAQVLIDGVMQPLSGTTYTNTQVTANVAHTLTCNATNLASKSYTNLTVTTGGRLTQDCLFTSAATTFTATVHGVVKDTAGNLVKGSPVTIAGTTVYTSSVDGPDAGKYRRDNFSVPTNNTQIQISFGCTTPSTTWWRTVHAGDNLIDTFNLCPVSTPAPAPTPAPTPTPTPTPSQQGSISGHVYKYQDNSTSRISLSEIKVSYPGLLNSPVKTDSTGAYSIPIVENTPRTLTITFRDDFRDKTGSKTVYIQTGANIVDYIFSSAETSASIVAFVYRDSQSKPSVQTAVTAYQPNKQNPTISKTGITDNDGKVSLDGFTANQPVQITAADELGNSATANKTLSSGGNRVDLTLQFRDYGNQIAVEAVISNGLVYSMHQSMVARVYDSQNLLVQSIPLAFVRGSGSSSTDSLSKFKGTGAPRQIHAGSYRVEVWSGVGDSARQSAAAQNVTFTSEDNETKNVNFDINYLPDFKPKLTVEVRGLISTQNGQSKWQNMAGASVDLNFLDNLPPVLGTTDSNGKTVFNLTDKQVGSVDRVGAKLAGFARSTQDLSEKDLNWEARLVILDMIPTGSNLASVCQNYSTASLPEFWFCGSKAQSFYAGSAEDKARISEIQNTISQLKQKFPKYKDTPPEVVISSSDGDVAQFQPIDKTSKGDYSCWPTANRQIPKDDSYIEFSYAYLKNHPISVDRAAVIHEWRHAADWYAGGCSNDFSMSSSDWTKYLDQLKAAAAFESITEGVYEGDLYAGHPQDNQAELVASAFSIHEMPSYYSQFLQKILRYSKNIQDLLIEVVNKSVPQ